MWGGLDEGGRRACVGKPLLLIHSCLEGFHNNPEDTSHYTDFHVLLRLDQIN